MQFDNDCWNATKVLYDRLLQTQDLDGVLSFDGQVIEWHRNCSAYLRISWETIEFFDGACNYHWHPNYDLDEVDAFYKELYQIGKKGNILVVRDCWIFQEMLYVGPASNYRSHKRYKIGKKYIFGDL